MTVARIIKPHGSVRIALRSFEAGGLRFHADGPTASIDANNAGRNAKPGTAELQVLARVIEDSPLLAIHGVVRWRLVNLKQWVWEEYAIKTSVQSLSEHSRALGYRKLLFLARPRPRPGGSGRLQ